MFMVGVASSKGGVGKTTISWNLAACFAGQGLTVCLADIDEQQNSRDHAQIGEQPFTVLAAIPKDGFDVCIIDHAPGTRAKVFGDVIVRPLKANSLDEKSYARATPMYSGKKVIPVINMLRVKSATQKMIADRAVKNGALVIRERTIYHDSIAKGLSVFNMKKRARYDAMKEITALANEVEKCLVG